VTRSARLLVVEDNPLSRRLAREILTHRGHQVFEAVSVTTAVECLSCDPELVIMDIEIEGGTGIDVLKVMRTRKELDHVPVIAVTASAMAGERERLLEIGFDAYMSKPIDTRNFGDAVEALLQSGRRKPTTAEPAGGQDTREAAS